MKRVGFIGLGTMGEPMAKNVVKKGFPLTVLDVVAAPVERLVAVGAKAASTPREVASLSDVVITMLPNSADVEQVVLGKDGIRDGAHRGLILIDMSTIDPVVTKKIAQELAASGVRMIDAPVGKPSQFAVDATLSIMAGGDRADVEECREILMSMGNTLFYCGPTGMGATMKVVNNLLSCTVVVATAEALVLGARSGLSAETMLEVLRQTGANNAHLHMTYPNKALKGDFRPNFMIDLAHKDLGLALAFAGQQGIPLAVGAAAREVMTAARGKGKGKLDWTAVMTVLEEIAKVEVRV